MKWMNKSITTKLIILVCSLIIVVTTLTYMTTKQINAPLLVVIGIALLFSFTGVVLVHRMMNKEKEKFDRIALAIKSGARGNYHTRIAYKPDDPNITLYEQFNELMEEIEQKVSYLQVLGEERVIQEATTVETAVHEERKRLARDLHDTVSQQLFAIQMSAASLRKLYGQNEEATLMVIDQLVQMSTAAQTQMRKLIAHLRPMELVNQTLSNALVKWFPDYCRQNHIQGHLDNRLIKNLSEAKEHQIFMAIQEAMANVVKHAKCNNCYLSLYETDSQVHIEIRDDGIGFDVNLPRNSSYGLITMQERAKKLGGHTEIISKHMHGTIVKIAIPKLVSGGIKHEQSNVS